MSESATTPASTGRLPGRHPVNIGHLVMGLAFLGLVAVWALVQGDVVEGDEIRWLLPVPFVVAGVAGLIASAVTGVRRHAVRQTGWVTPPSSTPSSTPSDPATNAGTDNHHTESHHTESHHTESHQTESHEENR